MFTAFNYYEPEEENRVRKEIKDSALFEKELKIAKRFVDAKKSLKMLKKCPVCTNDDITAFYEKWGISYMRCKKCFSIFADVENGVVQEYKKLPEMIELRTSEEYQSKASQNRKQMWDELFDWLKFRTYRYLGKNKELEIIDYGTRYLGLAELLKESDMCAKYELRSSILSEKEDVTVDTIEYADVILCMDFIQQENEPIKFLKEIKKYLKPESLLFLSTRVGSGFDILTLRGNNRNVFPYEHIMMPSKEGLKILLEEAGFEMLEITTPGTFDWNYVKSNREMLAEQDYFLNYFIDTATPAMEAEFQRFLQQSGMSSYAQVVAKLL